ncbi:MAG: glycosyltransferase family 2 protein [Verrucomicrobia bacterium]|nr:glycosyltransferase family 2 protein [Cytophagales bacterium]
MLPDKELSIILPCYNEAANIPLIFEKFKEAIGNDDFLEIILVNNGSTDNSASVFEAERLRHNDPRFRITRVEQNQGYGFGILSGLKAAYGKVLAWTHADLQTPPQDVLRAYQKYKEINDPMTLIKGKREGRAIVPALFTWGMQTLSSYALKVDLEDIAAQPKVFSREFYEKYLNKEAPYDFSLDLFAMYWAMKEGKVAEIPVVFEKRLHGEAKGGGNLKSRIKISQRTFKYIFELQKKLGV